MKRENLTDLCNAMCAEKGFPKCINDREESRYLEFANRYNKGERIYLSVLKKAFGDSADRAVNFLLHTKAIHEDKLLRCPHCSLGLSLFSDLAAEVETMACYHCDNEFSVAKAKDLLAETVYIKDTERNYE